MASFRLGQFHTCFERRFAHFLKNFSSLLKECCEYHAVSCSMLSAYGDSPEIKVVQRFFQTFPKRSLPNPVSKKQ